MSLLVAYSDDSDAATDSEDGIEVGGEAPAPVKPPVKPPGESQAGESRRGVDSIEDEDEDDVSSGRSSSTLFLSVPAAVPVTSLLGAGQEDEDEVVDVPTVETWKVTQDLKKQTTTDTLQPGTQHHLAHRKERKKVKILVPSLSEFSDEEEEMKEPPRKKLNPSSSGSGLFSVLPEPKHLSTKKAGRSLVPHVLTKKPPQAQKSQRKASKAAVVAAAAGTPAALGADHVSDDEDEAPTGTSDFFSLSEPAAVDPIRPCGRLAASQVPGIAAPNVEPIREVAEVLPCRQPEESPLGLEQQYQVHEEEGPSSMVSDPSQLVATAATAASAAGGIDDATILRLAGKRGRAEAISFIDVNADDALLTRHEWMTKALSEEKPQHSFSRKREGLPTQKQKQKHQITYLAHQAKERELDLKNSWAQNKMTKMQSQAKYGF